MKTIKLIPEMNKIKVLKILITLIFILSSFTSEIFSQITPIVSNGPLKLGQSVVTTYDPSGGASYVVRVIDTRNMPPFINGGNYWNAPSEFAGVNWNYSRMKNVYGIALDNANPPNIYVSCSALNQLMSYTDSVLIYKIDGATWNVSNLVRRNYTGGPPATGVNTIPNLSGVGIGNLCYDYSHNQILATNFEDGKIYRIGLNGNILSIFDPFQPDDGTSGLALIGERLFGIGSYGTSSSNMKIYFSRWNSDQSVPGQNEIWSVALDNAGEFIPTSIGNTAEISLPYLYGAYSNPVADIEFSFKGDMLLGERSMSGFSTSAHQSRILEYKRDINGSYNTNVMINIGMAGHTNSSGGVDFNYGISDSLNNLNTDCDSLIVGSGDYLFSATGGIVYGLQITNRLNGSSPAFESYSQFVDINGVLGTQDKTKQGDVDVYRKDLCGITDTNCITIVSDTTFCDSTGTYIYEFKVRNNSPTKTIEQVEITVDSPGLPNYVVTMPSTLNVTISPSGTSAVQRVKMIGPGAVARAQVCYTLSAHFVNDDCPWCCYIENCIKLPVCGTCVNVLNDSMYCSNGSYFYNFTLENGTIYDVTKIQITSPGVNPITFIPQIIHFTTPVISGQIFPVQNVQLLGGAPGMTIPIRIKLFSDDFECCYIDYPYTIPACDTSTLIGINNSEINLSVYSLEQNYPNPFNPNTYIRFTVPKESNVEISIFDVSGKLVKNLVNNVKYAPGYYSVNFDGSSLPSGMYFYRIKANDFIATRKMLLVK